MTLLICGIKIILLKLNNCITTIKTKKMKTKQELEIEINLMQEIIMMHDNMLRLNFENLGDANKAINKFIMVLNSTMTHKEFELEELKQQEK